MTSVHATLENVSRRGFLKGIAATGGLVVTMFFRDPDAMHSSSRHLPIPPSCLHVDYGAGSSGCHINC